MLFVIFMSTIRPFLRKTFTWIIPILQSSFKKKMYVCNAQILKFQNIENIIKKQN